MGACIDMLLTVCSISMSIVGSSELCLDTLPAYIGDIEILLISAFEYVLSHKHPSMASSRDLEDERCIAMSHIIGVLSYCLL